MKNQIILLGALIACGGLLAYSQILQNAQRLLSPEQLYALSTRVQTPWWKLLVPVVPVIIAFELLPLFPDRQAFLAVPALLLAVGLEVRFILSIARRNRDIELPAAFHAARRRATTILALGMSAGIGLAWIGMGLVPVKV